VALGKGCIVKYRRNQHNRTELITIHNMRNADIAQLALFLGQRIVIGQWQEEEITKREQ